MDPICRSALYVPASNARALAKGPTLGADAIVVDLEDSVAPTAKAAARAAAVRALAERDYGPRLRVLRPNGADTEWHAADVEAALDAGPDVVALPKVESPEALRTLAEALARDARGTRVRLWAMLETPLAVLRADRIAGAVAEGVPLDALVVGGNDLARASGMPLATSRGALLPWLMTFVAAAKAHRLLILDGVFNDFSDTAAFEAECAQGVALGMDGKTVIHPSQIDGANRAWTPAPAAVAEARAIVAAFAAPEAAGLGVLSLDGRMVERLHLDMARRTLALARRADPGTDPDAGSPPA